MVYEKWNGGSFLSAAATRTIYTEQDVSVVIYRVSEVLAAMHAQGINQGNLQITDLVFANADGESKLDVMLVLNGLHTISDMEMKGCSAPEVLKAVGGVHKAVTAKTDVWQLGMLAYLALVGFSCFPEKSLNGDATVKEKAIKAEIHYPPLYWQSISDSPKKMVEGMLQADEKERPSDKQIADEPFIISPGVPKVTDLQQTREEFWKTLKELGDEASNPGLKAQADKAIVVIEELEARKKSVDLHKEAEEAERTAQAAEDEAKDSDDPKKKEVAERLRKHATKAAEEADAAKKAAGGK